MSDNTEATDEEVRESIEELAEEDGILGEIASEFIDL